jgi:hypothetical protein
MLVAYVRAAADVAGFYKEAGNKTQAAAYRQALNALPAVSRSTDHDLIFNYGMTLLEYRTLLLELKKPKEAAVVEEAVKAIQARQDQATPSHRQ